MFGRRIGAFFSAPEIPFPGNGDRSRQRLGSNGQLLGRKPEHLVLAGPLGRQVGEADYSHAMRKPSFDRRLDEVGREEGKRDRHVDLADAAAECQGIVVEMIPHSPADERGKSLVGSAAYTWRRSAIRR